MIFPEGFITTAILLILSFVFVFCLILYVTTNPYPVVELYEDEKYHWNPKTGSKEPFPSLNEEWSVHLSVIVPAYNEEERLPRMLDECLEYLEGRKHSEPFTYELVVVSDGSTDRTVRVAQSFARRYETVKVLALVKNRGKGGAVRLGMQSARGSVLLFADADGATTFRDLDKLEASMKDIAGHDYRRFPDRASKVEALVCGSRAHLEARQTAKRSYVRLVLMHGFHLLVRSLCVRDIRDTQCGFKLLTREAARRLFGALHVERWAFDVELLYLAQTLDIPMSEIAVNWTEIEGSKLVPFWSWLQMGRDLALIWLKYKMGAWKIAKPKAR